MRTTDVDIRRIRVFLAVAQCGGFSAAQNMLNLSQSTISGEVAALETRLGYTLCRRGRGGFALTPQGEAFVADAARLLAALSQFELNAAKHKHEMLGNVRLAIIDNLITDPSCPLIAALSRFNRRTGGRAQLSLDVMGPDDIEQGLVSGRIDAAIGIFGEPLRQLDYHFLYNERDILVCGRQHPLYRADNDLTLFSKIQHAQKVVRNFLKLQDFFFLSDRHDTITGYVDSVEAAAVFVLAGHHIGFLPEHYARYWIERGDMRVLLESSYTRKSRIRLAHRKDAATLSALGRILIAELTGDTSGTAMQAS